MTDRREQIELGFQARQVLDNPAFVNAITALAEKVARDWLDTDYDEQALRESQWMKRRVLREITDELTILLDNGEIAAQQIEREESRNG